MDLNQAEGRLNQGGVLETGCASDPLPKTSGIGDIMAIAGQDGHFLRPAKGGASLPAWIVDFPSAPGGD